MNESRPPTVSFRTLGCKVNRVESEDIAASLLGGGFILGDEDDADVVVVNTCSVTGEADAKARKSVRQALGASRHPVVVVTGCLAALDAPALEALGARVVVEADKERVAERVAAALGRDSVPPAEGRSREGAAFRTRAMLKVEDGCDAFCSYCIVPYARGVPRSVPMSSVLREAEQLREAGTKEIVLTGINLGRYSDGGADLASVVSEVAAIGFERVRLSSIEPQHLDERLLGALSGIPSICPHLHVPLQSGSDAVLARMRRSYSVDAYRDRIANARAAIRGLAVTTDVIAGFPEETGRDAAETLSLCEELRFARLHVFRFSARAGTPAAQMPQVRAEKKASRASTLRALDARLRRDYATAREGAATSVIVERTSGGVAEGTTPDYLHVSIVHSGSLAVGDLVDVRLGSERDGTITGIRQETGRPAPDE